MLFNAFCSLLSGTTSAAPGSVIVTLGSAGGASCSQIQGVVQALYPNASVPGDYILQLQVSSATGLPATARSVVSFISLSCIVFIATNPILSNRTSCPVL